ncbi:DUF6146 family protein [Sinomicrobium weinanense]|uniref:Lipoprotein n=1 Tax=Sinomicrobium weinanense TaxID=2842200 RepID=A0A926JU72_9FLAO|nr:DUF6146 family protein [Sinomicrobium weinanense]MBC9797328.1 hypothetical protein [Sinomicrobium weinanense]MBU3122797.1 hypothetical protein [Sinomicrobium weinanense]
MKACFTYLSVILLAITAIVACNTGKLTYSSEESEIFNDTSGDTVAISNDSLEYEIIIIEPGFDTWLHSVARPEGYYSQHFLENRNWIYVTNWNQRVLEPFRYDPDLYTLQIDYDPNIDYGYEVNYKLYNYFIYFQRKYNQRLAGFIPRI